MADGTHIEWTDATWNVITGCSVVSTGCTNCYAMKLAGTRLQHHPSRAGLTVDSKAGPVWNGGVRFNEEWLTQPLRWRRPRRIFVCAHGDMFHESVPDEWIDRVFAVMALAPQHVFQVLTKRARRMREYLSGDRDRRIARACVDLWIAGAVKPGEDWPVESIGNIDLPDDIKMRHWPLPNVWLGVSAEDQARADERIPDLLATPAAVRWVSAEPLLGPVNFRRIQHAYGITRDSLKGVWHAYPISPGPPPTIDMNPPAAHLDWIVAGGESGPSARPMHPDWARSMRDQCAASGVAFHFKQWGAWAPVVMEPDEDGDPLAAYPMKGCSNPADHSREQECLFWQADQLVHWPLLTTLPAVGARRVGKARAGRLLDGREHNDMPGGRE